LRSGLPHSDIHGSKGARPSPQLFAACHVLHRLLAPRHPPDALFNASFFPDCSGSLYPCPENEPDGSISKQSVVFDQCRTHMSPKLSPRRTINRIGIRSIARSALAPKPQNKSATGELRITSNVRNLVPPHRSNDALTRKASIAHANSSSTMSMNVRLLQKTEDREPTVL
jgi:hypothetical protein